MDFPNANTFTSLGFLNNPMALGILLLVVLFLFGGKNIPQMMKGLGEGMREFRIGLESEGNYSPADLTAEKEREAQLRARIEQEVRVRMEAERREREELRS